MAIRKTQYHAFVSPTSEDVKVVECFSPADVFNVLSDLHNVITFSGGSIVALAFLRESKKLLETAFANRSRREITIKANGISVKLKGTNDINKAISAFEKATSVKPAPSTRRKRTPKSATARTVQKS